MWNKNKTEYCGLIFNWKCIITRSNCVILPELYICSAGISTGLQLDRMLFLSGAVLSLLPTVISYGSEVDVFSGVCLCVCLFVRMITSERLNAGWWNLVVRYVVQKSCPSSNVKVIGWGNQGQKTWIALPTPPGAYEWYVLGANSMQQQRTGPFHGLPGVLCSCVVRQFYAGPKITACCLVLVFVFILL